MEDLARHARRDTPSARPARGFVLPDPRGDIVADRARRSGTSGSPGGRFPARESSVSFFRLGRGEKDDGSLDENSGLTRVCARARSATRVKTRSRMVLESC